MKTMATCLEHKNEDIYRNAQRYFGGIFQSDDISIIDQALKHNLILRIKNIMSSSNSAIIKESLWTLSNLTASGFSSV